MSKNIKRLMAYVYMPLIFTLIGFLTLYIALKPVFDLAIAAGSMMIADDIPTFSDGLKDAFTPVEVEDVEEQEDVLKLADIEYPSYGTRYGQMSCERIQLDAPLYMGDSNAILKVGVGQYLGSFIPGYGRPIMLAAHCTTFFAPFEYIEKGDVVTVTTSYGVYQYEITDVKVVEPPFDDAYNLAQEKEQLIMYTCYPFKLLSGSREKRLFVYGDKIAGPDLVQ